MMIFLDKCRGVRRVRGSMALGFASLTVILFMMCSLILHSSLESYRGTTLGIQRLQARSAAEGAAIAAAQTADLRQLEKTQMELGNCLVSFKGCSGGPADDTATSQVMRLCVGVGQNSRGLPVATMLYELEFNKLADGTSAIARLEAVP